MKKIVLLFFITVVVLTCLSPTAALAESEGNPNDYFKEVWLDKLINALSVAAGVVGSVAVVLYKTAKTAKETKGVLERVGSKEKTLETILSEAEKNNRENEELASLARAALTEAKESEEKRDREIERIKRMLFVLATNDGDLVKKGYAKEIAEVAGYDEED